MATILVIDDNPTDRRLMTTILSHFGHDVVESAGADEGLAVARERRPDLVISDVLMPGMDGYAFAKALRADPATADVRLIFCTASFRGHRFEQLAEACGAIALIPKPSDPEDVLRIVDSALGRTAPSPAPIPQEQFDRDHLRIITDGLLEKVNQLEEANRALDCMHSELEDREAELRDTVETLKRVDAHRRQLLGYMVSAQEDERARIAGDIHDDSIQVMVAAGMRLELLRRHIADADQGAALAKLEDAVQQSVRRLRRLIFELRPRALDNEGVGAALRIYLDQMREDEGIVDEVNDDVGTAVIGDGAVVLYRLAQEALANVRKHARATKVRVGLSRLDDGFVLEVADDGVGFEPGANRGPTRGHMGLPSMFERAELAGGWCKVDSTPGHGTTVRIWVPANTTTA